MLSPDEPLQPGALGRWLDDPALQPGLGVSPIQTLQEPLREKNLPFPFL